MNRVSSLILWAIGAVLLFSFPTGSGAESGDLTVEQGSGLDRRRGTRKSICSGAGSGAAAGDDGVGRK